MRRQLAVVICIILLFGLTSCNSLVQGDETTKSDVSAEQDTVSESLTAEPTEENTEEPESDPVTGVTEVISAQFDLALPFSEGFAVVGKGGGTTAKYNYVDTEGNLLLEQWVDYAQSFSEGLACVGEDTGLWHKFGYIDTTGELVIPMDIMSSGSYCPGAFYQGYAEIYYGDGENYGSFFTNVIDREGNRLFDFWIDNLKLSKIGYDQRSGRSSELLAQMPEGGYYRTNEWMKAYVEGNFDEVIMYGQEEGTKKSYLVDSSGNLLRVIEGTVFKLGEDYYIRTDTKGPVEIYDRSWNLLDDKTYKEIEETEHGLYLAINTSGRYVLMNRYFTMFGEPYHEVKIVPDGYLTYSGMTYQWALRSSDGAEIFSIKKPMTECFYYELDCYTGNGYLENVRRIYAGTDKDSRQTTHIFDENGQILFSCTGVYKPEISLLTEDGMWLVEGEDKDMIFDQSGKQVFELPYAECKVYGANEEHIFLYAGIERKGMTGSPSKYVLLELTFSEGRWSCVEKGTESTIDFIPNIPGSRFVLTKNNESLIVSEGLRKGKVTLELTDGTVLEEDAEALTLAEDGLYIVEKYAEINGQKIKEARLKYKGENVSGAYENLDRLSEDYIAFCKDGKWGYLRIER